MPRISIVICTRNRDRLLRQCLDAVIRQTEKDFEVIVFNDASSDSTSSVITEYSNIIPITSVNAPCQCGLARARNHAVALSQGEWIAFCDDDDLWDQTYLSTMLLAADADTTKASLFFCWSRSDDNKSALEPQVGLDITTKCAVHQPITNSSCWFIRKNAWTEINGINPRIPRGIDGNILRRMVFNGHRITCVPEQLVTYRTRHNYPRMTASSIQSQRAGALGLIIQLMEFSEFYKKNRRLAIQVHCTIAELLVGSGHTTLALRKFGRSILRAPIRKSARVFVRAAFRKRNEG